MGQTIAEKPFEAEFQEHIVKTGWHLAGWRRTLRRALVTGALASMAQVASAESEYAAAWGPGVGATAPLLAAADQDGRQQSLDTLKGANGLLFVFNRSVDW